MGELATTNATYSLTSSVVRKLTGNAASFDELAQADYWEMYQRLRSKYPSLSKFAEAMGEYPSKAEWSRWDRGEIEARRSIRNALRAADGLPLLPPTISEVMDQHCDPDAPVFFLGDDNGAKAEAVLLVASVSAARITMDTDTTDAGVVESTPAATSRRPCYRPRLTLEIRELVGDDDVEELIRLGKQAKQQMEGWL
jgi:hypothetical protein